MFFAGNIFTSPPEGSLIYTTSYSGTWIIISILLAIFSSYAALRASSRIKDSHNATDRLIWSIVSSFTLGTGIWAMHFIGMLALSVPCIVNYNPIITMISMVPGILAAGIALGVAWHSDTHLSLLVRSILLGAGIGAMHYTGMMAMQLEGFVRYNPFLFILSFIVAILLAYIALSVKTRMTHSKRRHDALVAIILGGATSGMHYTAMSAAYFVSGDVAALPFTFFTTNILAITVAITTIIVALGSMVIAFISRNQEITQRLRNSEERWKFALEGAGDGVWDWNPQTDKAVFSRRWTEMIGYAEHEFPDTGAALIEHLHPDDKESVLKNIQEYIAGKQQFYTIEFRMRCKDNSWKWILGRGKTVRHDADGNPARIIGTHSDITERKQADEERSIAATAFESNEGMMITDSDGKILRINRAFTMITGYTSDEVVGQTPRILKSGRHSEEFYREMWQSINSTGGWQGEIWDRRKDGEEYPKRLAISAVKDNSGVVTHYIGTHYDITAQKEAEAQIRKLAFYDPLTELPNRTLMLDRMNQAMTISARSENYGALLLIDLDNFKMLNDTLGHDMGDQLLMQVADRLNKAVRQGDTVSRMGGDEFLVILSEFTVNKTEAASAAENIAEKICTALSQSYYLGDTTHQNTASIGVNLFRGHQVAFEVLLKQVDLAMYKSKSAGRNLVRFFDPEMESAVMERAVLEKYLLEAIQREQFILHYQAQVDNKGRPTGAEVLVRWLHPQRGMISPAEFIPLAEETGQILPLGQWVLETACKQLASWASQPEMAHLTISVNVSAKQFFQNDFVDQVLFALNDTGANPQKLKLELTESLLADDIQNIINKMLALKTKGVGFSLDDFGTGYSSLSYLKLLPLEQLKIDQSFVRDILNDKNDAAIAKTIVALASSLEMGVIAEGVETLPQQEFLASLGCHNYQGYLFSRPLPLESFEEFAQCH